jgi:hypothetical protein
MTEQHAGQRNLIECQKLPWHLRRSCCSARIRIVLTNSFLNLGEADTINFLEAAF